MAVNELGDEGCCVMAEALRTSSTLRHLNLAAVGATSSGMSQLAAAATGHPTPTRLNASRK